MPALDGGGIWGINLLPAAVDMPAPVRTTMRLACPSLMCCATAARLRSDKVCGGVSSSTSSEFCWPILMRQESDDL